MMNNIPNAQKPFVCSYSSLFTLIAIQDQLRIDPNDDLEALKIDYCDNLKDGVD